MDFKKTFAATVVATTLGVGGFALTTAGGATATPAVKTTVTTAPATSGKAKPKGHPELRRLLRRRGIVISAKALDMKPKALVAELRTGKSIAQVATEHNVPVATVESDLVNAADKAVDRAVANHRLTAERGAKIKARIPARVDKAVNHVVKAK